MSSLRRNKRLSSTGRIVCFLLIGLAAAGCESKVRWQEEVKLSTGEVITVDREVKHGGGGAAWPRGQGTIPREHLIRFQYPVQTGQVIEWRSRKLSPATYAELPLILDLGEDKNWFIFTRHWSNERCVEYVKYVLNAGVWTEPLVAEDIETYPTNLLLAASSNEVRGLISLSEKAKGNSDTGYPKHLRKVGPKRAICRPSGDF